MFQHGHKLDDGTDTTGYDRRLSVIVGDCSGSGEEGSFLFCPRSEIHLLDQDIESFLWLVEAMRDSLLECGVLEVGRFLENV